MTMFALVPSKVSLAGFGFVFVVTKCGVYNRDGHGLGPLMSPNF